MLKGRCITIKIYAKILDFACKVFTAINSFGLCAMFIVLLIQVFARYIFRYGMVWTDEFSRFIMVAIAMLGGAVLLVRDTHTRVTMLEEMAPQGVQKAFAFFRFVIGLVFAVGVLYLSKEALQVAALSVSPNMRIPMTYAYICFPIMSVLMILGAIYNILNLFVKADKSDPATESPEETVIGGSLE